MKPDRIPVPTYGPEAVLSQLQVEHQRLEERLLELDRNVYLTPDEQFERKRIQKLKLRAKDQIQRLTEQAS